MWVGGPVPLGYAAVAKKVVVEPAATETVRTIFARYLELGSVQALAQDLDRSGIRTKQRQLANGRVIGGSAFGVGGLAHLLRNRFYIGEVVYGGETFRGDHEPILDAALFADVQAKLSSQAAERRCRIRSSPALLTGRLFDVQGHRMTPTHTNKNRVRYLYYISQAALRKPSPPGSIARVPSPELEALVIDVLRRHLHGNGSDPKPIPETDRELIERHLLRVIMSANGVKVHLRAAIAGRDPAIGNDHPIVAGDAEATIAIPWPRLCAGPQHADEAGQPRGVVDCHRQGPQVDQGHRARSKLRRHRPSGRKG
jgi:site-specific DNA recombinase